MLAGIKAGNLLHKQSTFGPECDPATNLCKTAMCTAGHIVNRYGKAGYDLLHEMGNDFAKTAAILHYTSHPDYPLQNFGSIPQDWAMAYIEEMAAREAKENN